MPIVSISKIQHRYGLQENLPQLSTAELGWSLDQRKLFIGNGPISDGAPTVGNTEILTQHSDILALSKTYQFKGESVGYTHQTGVSMSSPTTSTLQRKLDERISVKDFGAVGDGVTDDTAEINRALNQVFVRGANGDAAPEVRRTLFFPAGVYVVSETIKIPSYAKITGEGKNSTIIRQTTESPAIEMADDQQNVDPNLTGMPSFIEINDISVENTFAGHVVNVIGTKNCIFRRVSLQGSAGDALVPGAGNACVNMPVSDQGFATSNIVFEQCDIKKNTFGVVAEGDINGILFNACRFHELYQGAKLGEDSSSPYPTSIKFTNCIFDSVYQQAINVFSGVSGIVSSYNHFQNVGNEDYNAAGVAVTPIITYGNSGNVSISDIFDRTAETVGDSTTFRVDGQGFDNIQIDSANGIYYGYHKTESGKSITLDDNESSATSTGITFDSTHESSTMIYYTAARGSRKRNGVLRITSSNVTDEFIEDGAYSSSDVNGALGLAFTSTDTAGTITLNYTTTSTGDNVTFKYRIERLV